MNSSFQPNVNPNIFLVQLNLDPTTFPSFQIPFCLSNSTCKNFAFIILFLHSTLLNGFTFITTYQDQILLCFQCSVSPSLACLCSLISHDISCSMLANLFILLVHSLLSLSSLLECSGMSFHFSFSIKMLHLSPEARLPPVFIRFFWTLRAYGNLYYIIHNHTTFCKEKTLVYRLILKLSLIKWSLVIYRTLKNSLQYVFLWYFSLLTFQKEWKLLEVRDHTFSISSVAATMLKAAT